MSLLKETIAKLSTRLGTHCDFVCVCVCVCVCREAWNK